MFTPRPQHTKNTKIEPYHHAHLWNNCSAEELLDTTCVLNITTVTENVYSRCALRGFWFWFVACGWCCVCLYLARGIDLYITYTYIIYIHT